MIYDISKYCIVGNFHVVQIFTFFVPTMKTSNRKFLNSPKGAWSDTAETRQLQPRKFKSGSKLNFREN